MKRIGNVNAAAGPPRVAPGDPDLTARSQHPPLRPDLLASAPIQDDACVLVSEMVTVMRVLAVTALDVCRRAPFELALAEQRAPTP